MTGWPPPSQSNAHCPGPRTQGAQELLPDLCFPSVALGKSTRQDILGILRTSLMPNVRIAEHKGAGPGVREALDAGTVRARSRALFLADIGPLRTIT